jgi:putative ABC transport system ATP-binding protein
MLELEGAVKHYPSGDGQVRAVDGVSFTIESGEMLALLGPSGSGKTTLLLLIAALLKPDAGAVRYQGSDIGSFSERRASEYLLRDVGFIFQNFRLMPRVPVLENAARKLLIGGMDMREAQARARPWLERVGLAGRLRHMPEKLSGGERQRVAIARALAPEPGLILADEPTGNLDSARSREIVELLRAVARERGACVLLVTHDIEVAGIADRCCTLHDGKLTDGRPADNRPADNKPTDNKPTDNKPTHNKPAHNKPTDNKPAHNKPTDNKPTDNKPAHSEPTDGKQIDGTATPLDRRTQSASIQG